MWNFKGHLWNFTQNFEPIHRKICILLLSNFCVWVTISLNCDVISLSETGPWWPLMKLIAWYAAMQSSPCTRRFHHGCQIFKWMSWTIGQQDSSPSNWHQGDRPWWWWLLKGIGDSYMLTHPLDKWPPSRRQYFQMHFAWMNTFVFWFEFHWSLFPRVQLTVSQNWIR